GEALAAGREARRLLLEGAEADAALAGSVSVNFLMLFGYLCGGWLMARSALRAQALLEAGGGDPQFLEAKLTTARFYAEHLLPRVHSLLAAVKAGSGSIMALADEQF
ncbi:acyl-CoA dehydrogenase C-terminal domain-containing protein, partial [Azotobacter beijerinckii]|uniref:acyl-CoA dehydrogenase C-terminal domain-containing protein n=1 Tax=Azotobacter beijerinckii TaxID=170623 RepID=UPI00295493DA